MQSLYQCDLADVHAAAFETLARGAAGEIVRRLQSSSAQVRKVMDVGCGAGPLTKALVDAGFDVTAVDTSAELLELARANVPAAHFVHASVYDVQIRDYDAVVAVGEPLTYHPEGADADNLISGFFQRVAETLPLGGLLIFDVIGQGQPSLGGRTWSSGDDWAVLVETTENHAERSLVRNIEVFRRVGDAYRRSHELHRVRLFDVSILCNQLASYGFATENVPVLWRSAAPYSAARFLCHTTGCNRLLTVPIRRAHLHGFPCRAVLGTYRQVGSNSKNGRTPEHSKAPKRLAA